MSIYPHFSNVSDWIKTELNRRNDNPQYVSGLNAWIRICSGVDEGLIIQSNTDFNLLRATGDTNPTIYGDRQSSGVIGKNWNGSSVQSGTLGLTPSPVVTSFEVDEGAGSISRKASISITAFSKQQAEEISKYFLEPGFSIFVEWGWNKPDAFIGFKNKLEASDVSKFQKFKLLTERREATKGLYDNFLGFITGGSISISDQTWEITVECTGYPELPAYLMIADTANNIEIIENEDIEDSEAEVYSVQNIEDEADLGFKRFKMMFNELPSNRRNKTLKETLESIPELINVVNYINFDEKIAEEINSKTDGKWWGGKDKALDGGEEVSFPVDTKLVGDEKFIRFGALMKIISTIGANSYQYQGGSIKFFINTENTILSAFSDIFSTDKSKLFIPNRTTPVFSFKAASEGNTSSITDNFLNNEVRYGEEYVSFPYDGNIFNNQIQFGYKNGKIIHYNNEKAKTIPINKVSTEWGFLDDLYVNFDFVKGIIETKNFLVKDALYQILNGMSSAAGSIWDFEIIESTEPNENGELEVKIIDKNFVADLSNPFEDILELDIINENSILIDTNFEISLSSNMMNQIIGKRLGTALNSSSPSIGKLYAVGLEDKILKSIEIERQLEIESQQANLTEVNLTPQEILNNEIRRVVNENGLTVKNWDSIPSEQQTKLANSIINPFNDNNPLTPGQFRAGMIRLSRADFADKQKKAEEDENKKEALFKQFLDNIALYPRVELEEIGLFASELRQLCYVAVLNDSSLFEKAKIKNETITGNRNNSISILLPVEFSFTIHGISGIKRGDKFKVNGLPYKYSEEGFFQVTEIKHTIEGMNWKVNVKGGFRTININ